MAWSKLCNLKNVVFKIFTSILTILGIHEPPSDFSIDLYGSAPNTTEKKRAPHLHSHYLASSTPTMCSSKAKTRIDFHFDGDLDFGQQHSTPYNNSSSENKIVNSTPVNHNHGSFRSRKDLTKTCFK